MTGHLCDSPGCAQCFSTFNRTEAAERAAEQARALLLAAPQAVRDALDDLHAKRRPRIVCPVCNHPMEVSA